MKEKNVQTSGLVSRPYIIIQRSEPISILPGDLENINLMAPHHSNGKYNAKLLPKFRKTAPYFIIDGLVDMYHRKFDLPIVDQGKRPLHIPLVHSLEESIWKK